MTAAALEDLLRELTPQVLGTLVRRHGQCEDCEDAVQEAVLAATGAAATAEDVPDTDDDTLVLLFLCCHPALTAASQTALTLRAASGLTTAEIARAFLVPEATMAARISRAKQRIKAAGSSFGLPGGAERAERLRVVLHMLYLIFNEGYTASSGSALHRADLAREAIRLARIVHAQLPGDGEVTGLLALMLLTHARRTARTTASGDLVPPDEQDRTQWDRALIGEGMELVKASPDGHPQPGDRARRDRGPAGRAGPAVHAGRGRADGRASPAAVGTGASAGEDRRHGRGVRALPARREGHRQHRRAALPAGPGRPGTAAVTAVACSPIRKRCWPDRGTAREDGQGEGEHEGEHEAGVSQMTTTTRPTLCAQMSRRLVDAAVAAAAAGGLRVTVVTVDESGVLREVCRMDGAPLISLQTAISKAYAAAAIGMPPDDFFAAIEPDPAAVASFANRPGLALIAGGLPVLADGEVAGAIGVAGAMTAAEDRAIAEAALAGAGAGTGAAAE